MTQTSSIVVIGGGPAGAATALELAQAGCDVVLLERQRVAGWKIGETLPPESRVHLQRLGLWERFLADGHLQCHGVVSVWGHSTPVEKDFIFNPNGNAWQLDRAVFENMLLSAAAGAGCRVCLNENVEEVSPTQGGWLIRTSTQTIFTDWLIDASGRSSDLLRSERGQYQQLDQLISIYAITQTNQTTDHDARTWVESHPEGWCYTALMPSGKRTVALQTDSDLATPENINTAWLSKKLEECQTINELLRKHNYEFTSSPRWIAAHSARFEHCGGQNWLAVGDAAMTFDPLSGLGSLKALESASNAVQSILYQADYPAVCEMLWGNFRLEYDDYYRAELQWSDSPFWRRRR